MQSGQARQASRPDQTRRRVFHALLLLIGLCYSASAFPSFSNITKASLLNEGSSTDGSMIPAVQMATSSKPAVPQTTLQILASAAGVQDQQGNTSKVGHAFMIISVPTRTGIKEDAFGFYPRIVVKGQRPAPSRQNPTTGGLSPTDDEVKHGVEPTALQQLKMIVGFPGALNSEFRRNPTRLAHVNVSFEIPISDIQKKAIFDVVTRWNEHEYALIDSSCVTFIADVAKAIGLPTVNRVLHPLPADYVQALKTAYERQVEDNEAARRAEEARRISEEQRIQKEAEAAKARHPDIGGQWFSPANQGIYVISQSGENLTCSGHSSASGKFTGPSTIIMYWPKEAVQGAVSSDGSLIQWNNGSSWNKR